MIPRNVRTALLQHWEPITLALMLVIGFLLRFFPLLKYPHVGGDPFVHYRYSMALLDGRMDIAVQAGKTGNTMDLYYPPFFHLISLLFFEAFPAVDPYTTMKILASAFDVMQVIPIYMITKHLSGSGPAAILSSYLLIACRSDYEMLSWGGYANILGLLLTACLVYVVLTSRFVSSLILSGTLALTHDLAAVVMFAVLLPYFVLGIEKEKRFPVSLLGCLLGVVMAYVLFYHSALPSIFEFYTKYTPHYDQSLYVTPYILEQVGPLTIGVAILGLLLVYLKLRGRTSNGTELLLIWSIIPLLFSYAYLFGVDWHGVRWIAFIPQPLAVLAGMGFGILQKRKLFLVFFAVLFTLQLIFSVQGYHYDILHYVVP